MISFGDNSDENENSERKAAFDDGMSLLSS